MRCDAMGCRCRCVVDNTYYCDEVVCDADALDVGFGAGVIDVDGVALVVVVDAVGDADLEAIERTR